MQGQQPVYLCPSEIHLWKRHRHRNQSTSAGCPLVCTECLGKFPFLQVSHATCAPSEQGGGGDEEMQTGKK